MANSLDKTTYDRSACEVGIVHVGYGAFHRAHQSVYIDDYMQATGDLSWGIAAVNLRPQESATFAEAAKDQDGYVLKAISPDGDISYRLVRSHVAFQDAAVDLSAALDLFARPSVRAASMTVTESGYSFKDDWSLDLTAPAVAEDLKGGQPDTIYGFLAQALAHRKATLNAPITLLCCDNIRNNGKVLKNALLSFLDASGQGDIAEWARENVTFPCSMVDRITPRSSDELNAEIAAKFPSQAAFPIHAESFTQWVLEDNFAAEMPDLTKVGVEVVDNVEPYEEAKIRILNGGHSGLTFLGALKGYTTFDEAMRDAELREHFDQFEKNEVLPGLAGKVPFDMTKYLAEIAARFENPGIADQLERICMDGYSKMSIYIRPTLEACLAQGIDPQASYDCAASWVVFARRHKTGKNHFPYHEPFWDRLSPLLEIGREHDIATDPQLWADLPTTYDEFVPNLVSAIQRMDTKWQA